MKHKKTITMIVMLSIILCICAGVLVRYFQKQDDKYIKSAEEGDVSRYQWMEMLCVQSGLTEYKNTVPYYEDVDAGSPYFSYIQSAVEWDVLPGDAAFEGNGYASGRFVALTAMKTLGERKLMMYLETEDALSDDAYLQLAMEHGLIEKDRLAEGVSQEECERILENLRSLYFGEFWRDDYSNVVYQDGVVELSSDEVVKSNADGSEIVVSGKALDELTAGTVIVFEEKNTKCKLAREIIRADTDGTLSLSPVELERVVESLTESDITEVTFEDIAKNYASAENNYSLMQPGVRQGDEVFMDMGVFSGEERSKGYKITCSTEEKDDEKYLEVKITDHATGVSMAVPVGDLVKLKGNYSAELDVKKILIGTQADYRLMKGGLQYAEVAVDVESTLKGEIKAEEEKEIPLCTVPIPIAGGVASVKLQLSLVLSIEGAISLEAELPVGVTATYEKGKELRHEEYAEISDNPKIEANCEAGVKARIEPIFAVLGGNIMDVEADAGVTANAKITPRSNSQICAEVAISLPVVSLSVCGDDDTDTLIGNLGFSAEWEIITAENAPLRKSLHYECLPDQTTQFVDACTYQETEEDEKEEAAEEEDTQVVHTYRTRYKEMTGIDSPIFCFDYPDGWSVSMEEVNGTGYGAYGVYAKEVVELANERGVTVHFMKIDGEIFDIVDRNRFYSTYSVEKMADMDFAVPDENASNPFVVVKLTLDESLLSGIGEWDSGGSISYAVMQNSVVEESGYSLSTAGMLGYDEAISFDDPTPYIFCASSPDGQYTEEEEKEVIAILSSFREAQ